MQMRRNVKNPVLVANHESVLSRYYHQLQFTRPRANSLPFNTREFLLTTSAGNHSLAIIWFGRRRAKSSKQNHLSVRYIYPRLPQTRQVASHTSKQPDADSLNAMRRESLTRLPPEIQMLIIRTLLEDADEAGNDAAVILAESSSYWQTMVDTVAKKVREDAKRKRTLKRLMKDERSKLMVKKTSA